MIRLNLGSGGDYRQGYTNVDVRDDVKADLVCDLMEINVHFQTNTVDEILANDILEHFSFRVIEKIISKLYWIMKLGALIIIRVPDLDALTDKYKQGLLDADSLSYFLYGAQDYEYNYHYNGFSYNSLKSKLLKAGFREISQKIQSANNFIIKARK